MKIAILSPIYQPVPPTGWGGVELVVYNLVEELVKRGHEVILFSAEGAKTSAKNITNGLKPADHDPGQDADAAQKKLDQILVEKQSEFDLIHAHTSHRFPYLEDKLKVPYVLTVHTIYREEWKPNYTAHPNIPIVSISDSQAKYSGLKLNFIGTVYNGIDLKDFEFDSNPKDYFVWVGRIVRNKGLLGAIEIAKKADVKLKIAGPFIYNNDDDKKNSAEVKEAIKHPLIEYVGEVDKVERCKLMKDAIAFINPIIWNEPFGLVVPESNASGCPVVAYDRGAMPELIKSGYNGYVCKSDDDDAFIAAMMKIKNLEDGERVKMRQNCRRQVEENFTVQKMVDGYEAVYKKVIEDFRKNS